DGPPAVHQHPGRPMNARSVCAAAALLLAGCITPAPPAKFTPLPEERVQNVDQVIFFVGDAGLALWDASPLMRRLQLETERWSDALARPEAVSVVFLGDN